ncbi:16796_t:CDS:2 [Cetraspora pellucida]|uniref:16796_t:CDS:1 n=1 Tax=Cetraspora pellucida TaxID=1433469 RepID=A0ACA9KZ98_9GLOM|nr:16796_t:CDS:2 [Cetraspora pellucida]
MITKLEEKIIRLQVKQEEVKEIKCQAGRKIVGELIIESFPQLEKELNIPGTIKRIDTFATWFNDKCAIVINRVVWHAVRIIIHDKEKISNEVVKVYETRTLREAEKVAKVIKKKLNSSNPVLALSPIDENPFVELLISKNVRETSLPANIKPEEHLKEHDIVLRKIKIQNLNTPTYHAAIYLGGNEVAHISKEEGENTKEKFRARRDKWEQFIGNSSSDLICYRPIIPFKRPEKIEKHIKKAIDNRYGEGEYRLLGKNCEHFATLCVYDFDFSKQANKVKFYTEGRENYLEKLKKVQERGSLISRISILSNYKQKKNSSKSFDFSEVANSNAKESNEVSTKKSHFEKFDKEGKRKKKTKPTKIAEEIDLDQENQEPEKELKKT